MKEHNGSGTGASGYFGGDSLGLRDAFVYLYSPGVAGQTGTKITKGFQIAILLLELTTYTDLGYYLLGTVPSLEL